MKLFCDLFLVDERFGDCVANRRLTFQRPAVSHAAPRGKFVPFTSALVAPSAPSNLPPCEGICMLPCQAKTRVEGAPELRGSVLMDWGEARGISSDRWNAAGTTGGDREGLKC